MSAAALPDGILIGWYGDDFTGAAAVMEALDFAGLPAALFFAPPTEAQLARFPGLRAVGLASTARTQSPDWMEAHLPAAFETLVQTGARVIHYKTCSTLDSAPETGSIGRAIDIGARTVPGKTPVPVLVAAPNMRRYQAFGHLFAGAPDGVFRLDRHPVMARHPVTPMEEADVALHLSQQTDRRLGLIDLEDLARNPCAALRREIAHGTEIVTLDAMRMEDMAICGGLIWSLARPGPALVAGSQGVEYALVEHWRETGALPRQDRTDSAGAVERIVAVSGSVSPVTAAQIDWAEAHGFAAIALDAAAVAGGDSAAEAAALQAAKRALSEGKDPLIYSARGPDDPGVARVREMVAQTGLSAREANARIGAALGRCLRRMISDTGLNRAVISGGDTSGMAAQALDLWALTALAPTIPGAGLMRGHSDTPALDGLQLALKGGQMGSEDFFGWIKRGGGTA